MSRALLNLSTCCSSIVYSVIKEYLSHKVFCTFAVFDNLPDTLSKLHPSCPRSRIRTVIRTASWQQAISWFFLRHGAIVCHCLCVFLSARCGVTKARHCVCVWVYSVWDNSSKSLTHIGPVWMVTGHCYSRSQTAGLQKRFLKLIAIKVTACSMCVCISCMFLRRFRSCSVLELSVF